MLCVWAFRYDSPVSELTAIPPAVGMPPPIITHNSFIQTILIISHHSSNSLLLQTPHWTFPRRRKTPVAPAAGSTERPGRRILTVVCGWDLSSSAFSCSHASEGSDIASITALNCVLGNVYWFRGSEVCCDVPQNAAELIISMSSLERPNRLIGKKNYFKKMTEISGENFRTNHLNVIFKKTE